jgi:mono/diheme cytochrome c family protein
MRIVVGLAGIPSFLAAVGLSLLAIVGPAVAGPDEVERGAYLFRAGLCAGCHTDENGGGQPLAGGPVLQTPFGTFRGPNISSDPDHGIGRWTDADFIRAMREGVAPDGRHYYPAFPYTAFTQMVDADLLALKAYILSLPPVATPSREHDLSFPFSLRWLMWAWKWLYFTPGPFVPDTNRDADWNRGAYLVEGPAHCGECHTPRGLLGGVDGGMSYAGTADGPEGKAVPNITPDPKTGIGDWSAVDLTYFLDTGILPDGDVAGGLMDEVIRQGTGRLTPADRHAIAVYLRALPPIENKVSAATP